MSSYNVEIHVSGTMFPRDTDRSLVPTGQRKELNGYDD